MTIKNFFKLAQMQTTISTFLTTLLGVVYAWYNYKKFNPVLSVLTVIFVVLFLMAVNIRDNYVDYEVASKKGDISANDMIIGKENLKLRDVRLAYKGLGIASGLIGIFLVSQTSIFALYAGIICFLIGILYAAGPLPISSTPFGEVATGIAMGFGVFFSTFYVNTFEVLEFNVLTIFELLLASSPTTIVAINIVLANNICDVEEDIEDERFSLPYYLGIEKSLLLYRLLYYLAYISIIISVAIGIFPGIVLLSLFSFFPVEKNIGIFMKDQNKDRGLGIAVINSVIISASILIFFAIDILFRA